MASYDKTTHPGGETTSVWQGTFTVPSFEPLRTSTTAEVCVVGAGIAGLSTAYLLSKAGKRVVVVDDGPIGGGETGRTTAHLTNAMDDRIFVLEKLYGEEKTRYIVESHTAAIHRMEMIVKAEKIDCDFRRLDGYLFPARPDQVHDLDKELAAAHRSGLVDVRRVDRAPIAGFETGPALKFPEQGQLHSLKYLAGLAKAITANGERRRDLLRLARHGHRTRTGLQSPDRRWAIDLGAGCLRVHQRLHLRHGADAREAGPLPHVRHRSQRAARNRRSRALLGHGGPVPLRPSSAYRLDVDIDQQGRNACRRAHRRR
jgi:glycine/D-amino acid oxidase-like deaminating enzyme